jgi:hypothetical protein
MPSQISWLDFSDSDRRKMIEVVQLFREQDTRDELGIASIRDTLAELLFPGTGTLQSRARYFLFVPWHCFRLERKKYSDNRARDRLRSEEINVINALIQRGETGIIGQRSGASLHRFPSSIYWNGLKVWGILRFSGSPGQYFQSLGYYYHSQKAYRLMDKDNPILENPPYNWDPDIPKAPKDFPGDVDLTLSFDEATYLKERLQISCPHSLLAYLVRETESIVGINFPWHHPDAPTFPEHLQQLLLEAENFSETLWGAALLYNYLLAEKAGMDEMVEEYQEQLTRWQEIMQARAEQLTTWNIEGFWRRLTGAGKIPLTTQRFVNSWLDLVIHQPNVPDLVNNTAAHEMIQTREFQLKRGRSRFENPRRLEMWGGRSGAGQLNFRWPVSNQIANDILNGLAQG